MRLSVSDFLALTGAVEERFLPWKRSASPDALVGGMLPSPPAAQYAKAPAADLPADAVAAAVSEPRGGAVGPRNPSDPFEGRLAHFDRTLLDRDPKPWLGGIVEEPVLPEETGKCWRHVSRYILTDSDGEKFGTAMFYSAQDKPSGTIVKKSFNADLEAPFALFRFSADGGFDEARGNLDALWLLSRVGERIFLSNFLDSTVDCWVNGNPHNNVARILIERCDPSQNPTTILVQSRFSPDEIPAANPMNEETGDGLSSSGSACGAVNRMELEFNGFEVKDIDAASWSPL